MQIGVSHLVILDTLWLDCGRLAVQSIRLLIDDLVDRLVSVIVVREQDYHIIEEGLHLQTEKRRVLMLSGRAVLAEWVLRHFNPRIP